MLSEMTDQRRRIIEESDHGTVYTSSQYRDQILPNTAPVVIATKTNEALTLDIRRVYGWDIGNFHRRVKEGQLLPHTPWYKLTIIGQTSGDYSSEQWVPKTGTPTSKTAYYCSNGWNSLTDWVITEENLAENLPPAPTRYVTEAAAKIYNKGYDALTSLAELVEVRRLFVGTAKKLLAKKLPRNWRSLSSEWLSARYGWRTLVYDIKSLDDAIRNFDESRARHSESSGTRYSTTYRTHTEVNNTAYVMDKIVDNTITTELRGSVTADIKVPRWQFNPVSTAWELVPLSFVVDWVFNVGKTLSAYSLMTFARDYSASAGIKLTIQKNTSYSFNRLVPTYPAKFQSLSHYQNSTCEAILVVRTPCTVPLTPSHILRLNSFKVVDLLALGLQKLR